MNRILDANIVKIAVELDGQIAQLIEFNQKQPLASIIQHLCTVWDLSQPDQYSLQFSDHNHQNYVTEKNRGEIKNGDVLRLAFSPAKTSLDILQKLNADSEEEKLIALKKLSSLCVDVTFALEFINKRGLDFVVSMIEQRALEGAALACCLLSFVELMDHGVVSWDILEPKFVTTVAKYVTTDPKIRDSNNNSIVQSSLSILESIVLNSSNKYAQVEREVPVLGLAAHLDNSDPIIQQNVIALINALFLKADGAKKIEVGKTVCCQAVRSKILINIIEKHGGQVGVEMAHQLYVLQTLCMSLMEHRMNTKMDALDQESLHKIQDLRRIAYEIDTSSGHLDTIARRHQDQAHKKDYKKLGFKYDVNPVLDFMETPPGMLALDCMMYFAANHVEQYTKVVLENSCRADEHECPFGRTSVELVKLLCQVLRIGDAPNEQNTSFHPMFFTSEHPFHEFYSICIVLLNKTWKEMRATIEDFAKVFSVVREQIVRALASQPTTFDKFRQKLQTLTYSEITNLWQQERTSREEWESHAKPIVQLKEIITPEIVELIRKQRLNYLADGTRFTKYSQRGQRVKDKFCEHVSTTSVSSEHVSTPVSSDHVSTPISSQTKGKHKLRKSLSDSALSIKETRTAVIQGMLLRRIEDIEASINAIKLAISNCVTKSELEQVIKLVDNAGNYTELALSRAINDIMKSDVPEQRERINNLRFYNLYLEKGASETPFDLKRKLYDFISEDLGIQNFPIEQIDRCHRNKRGGFNGRPKTVIARFQSYAWRTVVYRAFIKANKAGDKTFKVIVREDLTADRLAALKKLIPEVKKKAYWTFDGNIFWVDSNDQKHMIANPNVILDDENFNPLDPNTLLKKGETPTPDSAENISALTSEADQGLLSFLQSDIGEPFSSLEHLVLDGSENTLIQLQPYTMPKDVDETGGNVLSQKL